MESLLFWCFTLLVCLAPLPFGGNLPWAWSLLALLLGGLALLWGLTGLVSRGLVTLRGRRSLPYAVAMLLLTLWYLLQAAPITPAAWQDAAWAEAAAALGIAPGGALSLTPDRTLTGLMRLLSYGASLWLALHLLRRRRRAAQFLWALTAAGVAYALYGLVEHLGGGRTVLWLEKTSYFESLTSTFINRNAYAAYAGLGLVIVTGLLLHRLGSLWVPRGQGWRLALVSAMDGLGVGVWLLLGAFLVLVTALLLTGSRGGLLATAVGLAGIALLVGQRSRRRGFVALGLLLTLGLFAWQQSGGLVTERLTQLPAAAPALEPGERGDRLALYALAARLIAKQPLAGTGLGSFPSVYLAARGPEFGLADVTHVRVHNSYLEVLLESGLPAGLLLLALPALAFFLQVRALGQAGVERRFPAIAAAATLLFAAHSLIDFSLQLPGIAITYAALLGLGVAQSYPHRQPRPTGPETPLV